MVAEKSIILITGANGGIGFEVASQLLLDPSNHILLGSCSAEKGEAAVKDLQSRNQLGNVEILQILQIDVADEESIKAAATVVESKFGRLTALVNNAAIGLESMDACFRTNATGPHLTVVTFAPLLLNSPTTARIINVTSGAASIARRLDPSNFRYTLKNEAYRASKAALNMIMACQVVEYGSERLKVFLFWPGFTVSNLGPMNKAEHEAKPTSEGARPIVGMLKGERDVEAGCFLHAGGRYPW